MAQTGVYYPNAVLQNSPVIQQAPLVIGNAGGSLALQSGAAFTQYGSSVAPVTPPAGALASYVTAAGQPGYINPQGLKVLESGIISGSVLTGPVTVASGTAETSLVTGAIPANDPIATALYYIKAGGVFSTASTPTLTFTLRYGGVSGTSMAAIPAVTGGSSVTNCCFEAEGWLTVYSATSAVGLLRVGIGTSASTDATSMYVNSSTAATAIVSSSAKNLVLDFAWGTSSASNTLSAFTGYAMRLA